MKRADAADFVGAMAGEPAGPLFRDPEADPFRASKIEPTAVERVVAGMILACRGAGRAIAARDVCQAVGLDDRSVRGIVEQLIVAHRLRIGSSAAGYYAIETAADLEMAVGRYRSQIFSMWRRLRVLMDGQKLAELHGQLGMGGEE